MNHNVVNKHIPITYPFILASLWCVDAHSGKGLVAGGNAKGFLMFNNLETSETHYRIYFDGKASKKMQANLTVLIKRLAVFCKISSTWSSPRFDVLEECNCFYEHEQTQ